MNYKMRYTLFLISLFMLFACGEKEEKSCCKMKKTSTEEVAESLSSESLFNLESRWVKQNGDSISLADFSGKITIAAMVFTHCQSACPRIIADMQRIEKSLNEEELKNIQFLLISMDPERDTPKRFVEFSKEHQLKDWTCISSNEEATMEMANILNVRVKKLSDGGFDHSNTIHLWDKNGNILFQQNGLEQEPDELISKIKSILKS